MSIDRVDDDLSATTGPPRLVVGPLLRYVDSTRATVWLQLDRPATIEVSAGQVTRREHSWVVHGHHYCLLILDGLEPGTVTEYQITADGHGLWPDPSSDLPPSVIRTLPDPSGPASESFRLSFGSCRRSAGDSADDLRQFGADALVALSRQMRHSDHSRWPDALFLAGDQVYADNPSPEQLDRLRKAHTRPDHQEVRDEIQNFEEYTWLYEDSWMRPDVRWLLSSVPTVMLLDDHDLRDDWNTSQAWRDKVTATAWWRERVLGALVSYWVYQHLGNLSPDELADDELFALVRSDTAPAEIDATLDEFAWRADHDPSSARWSFIRDFGPEGHRVRLVAVDARCSRDLRPGHRAMLDAAEQEWFDEAVLAHGVQHLLIGASLPILTVPGIHHLEGWNEALADGRHGRTVARVSERLRQAVDLEHWAAFRRTMHRVFDVLGQLGARPDAPASVLLLSGDVHCSYVATAQLPGIDPARTGFHQLTMSPFRNPLEPPIRVANRLLSWLPVRNLLRRLASGAGVPTVAAEWEITEGLWFDNGVMTLSFDGRRADVEVDHAAIDHATNDHATIEPGLDGSADPPDQVLRRTTTMRLTPSAFD